ncbi:hypothetical protein ACROYT_G041582 [Oculina patagonica]
MGVGGSYVKDRGVEPSNCTKFNSVQANDPYMEAQYFIMKNPASNCCTIDMRNKNVTLWKLPDGARISSEPAAGWAVSRVVRSLQCLVNFELRRLAKKKGPDIERFNQLANSVEEFTTSLLDPMRSDEGLRKQFGDYLLDEILYDAVEFEQKKHFSLLCTGANATTSKWNVDTVAGAYLMYLEIPYLKFVRDTLSYLTLLVLHYALCLAPSTTEFSGLEWAILIFFLGRSLVEWKQICDIVQRLKRQDERQDDGDKSNYIILKSLCIYLSDCWNRLDFISLLVYLATFLLRVYVATCSKQGVNNRALLISSFLYGFNSLCLTFRAFGHVMEQSKHIGTIQIALFSILSDIRIVLGQFVVAILAFSFALAKVYMAEKIFIGESRDAHGIWWTMFKHLGFSLLGSSEFDPMMSVDLPTGTLALLLYSVFLILGVILLINMLIALLSHTYERTEENSIREWSFKRAVTIEAYADYDPIPVPLNIIYRFGKLLWHVAGITRDEDTERDVDIEFIKSDIFGDLEEDYFAKHTNLFPVTDEKKLDQVLHETERNRQMVSQILSTTCNSQGSDVGILLRGPEAWKVHEGIQIEGLLLTCEHANKKHFHGARYLKPFSPAFPHFEVTILETGDVRWPGIGVVDENYDTSRMPGWEDGSLGYHTDDGKIYHNDTTGRETKGPSMARRGDMIRCTVMFDQWQIDQNGHGKVPVCFTLNGRKIIIQEGGEDQSLVDHVSSLYPYIGMTDGCSVLAKMCPRENKEYQVSKIAQIEKQLEDTNRKLDILLARESARVES